MNLLSAASQLLACPLCSEALSSQKDQALAHRLTQGFGLSIYFLMATPYVLFTIITFLIVRSARRKDRAARGM